MPKTVNETKERTMYSPAYPRDMLEKSYDHTFPLAWFVPAIIALVAIGCEGDTSSSTKRPATRALDQTGITTGDPEQAPSRPRAPVKQSGPIIGQRTTDIRNAAVETKKENAQNVQPRIIAKDPITLSGNAYVSIIGRVSILRIQQAMDLYRANNDRYPKDYDEFMTEIIKASNIALPTLPPRQKYGYDEKEHKLVILEYPDPEPQ
jgi:hypothetical protein